MPLPRLYDGSSSVRMRLANSVSDETLDFGGADLRAGFKAKVAEMFGSRTADASTMPTSASSALIEAQQKRNQSKQDAEAQKASMELRLKRALARRSRSLAMQGDKA